MYHHPLFLTNEEDIVRIIKCYRGKRSGKDQPADLTTEDWERSFTQWRLSKRLTSSWWRRRGAVNEVVERCCLEILNFVPCFLFWSFLYLTFLLVWQRHSQLSVRDLGLLQQEKVTFNTKSYVPWKLIIPWKLIAKRIRECENFLACPSLCLKLGEGHLGKDGRNLGGEGRKYWD